MAGDLDFGDLLLVGGDGGDLPLGDFPRGGDRFLTIGGLSERDAGRLLTGDFEAAGDFPRGFDGDFDTGSFGGVDPLLLAGGLLPGGDDGLLPPRGGGDPRRLLLAGDPGDLTRDPRLPTDAIAFLRRSASSCLFFLSISLRFDSSSCSFSSLGGRRSRSLPRGERLLSRSPPLSPRSPRPPLSLLSRLGGVLRRGGDRPSLLGGDLLLDGDPLLPGDPLLS